MSFSTASQTAPTSNRSHVETIVSTVAAEKGVSETEIEPLYETIDPDALENLLASSALTTVAFEFEGYEVIVDGTGRVELRE